jgi:hypothetical protein
VRRSLQSVVLVVAFTALPGCGTTPVAPTPASSAEFDPTALFARLAGPYTLTIEANENCPVPPSVEVLSYDVLLHSEARYRYLGIRASGEDLVGDLWALATEEEGLMFRWNVDCEGADMAGSTAFYLCGQGYAFAKDGTIAGLLVGDYRPFCTNGAHRFVFQRRS